MKLFALISSCLLASPLLATSAPVDFSREIQPLLAKHCYECHGDQHRKGGLRLNNRKDAFEAADSGAAVIVAGDSNSELLRRVKTSDEDDRMPPKGDPLAPEQIALLERWIQEGASWPDELSAAPAHWAYVKPDRAALPPVKNTRWAANAVDAFILARLEKEGFQPSPPAAKEQLLRRVWLDLVGLPPGPADVEAFVRDPDPRAYERVVDRLLMSPQYGERWARQWLDLARYADSNGFQRDGFRDLWAYRDWVIQAFNAGMPFDQFTIEQLAGDLLPDATLEQKIATGFNRCTTVNVEAGTDQEENRVNQVVDRVNTTSTVWLGTTMECAQCHNHKYDPFSQREYYQLFAFFNNTEIETKFRSPKATASVDFVGPMMTLPDDVNATRRAELQGEVARLSEAIAARKKAIKKVETASRKASAASEGAWHELDVASFQSAGGATGAILPDKSVLVGGKNPIKDTYTVLVRTALKDITAIKLEVLTDDSLPGKGPGRGDAVRPNFILNEFRLSEVPETDPNSGREIPFMAVRAGFSQTNWDVSGAIDGNPKSGWGINPRFHEPHHAIFVAEEGFGSEDGSVLTFTLEQNHGGSRTIGRFRLSALTGSAESILAGDGNDAQLAKLQKQQDAVANALKELPIPQTLVMQEMAEPRMTSVFIRGNFLDRGEAVQAGTPAILHALPDGPSDRLTLARWLVDRENPLVARVTVNRWWAEFFGHGIVATAEDFGLQGERPTHPELLDWLAVEFMESGWSMKAMHKLIVMSATYRQNSKLTPWLAERDDRNLLYARGPRFRLDAETIRDNALTAAGLLSLKQGGPPIRPFQPSGVWTVTGLVNNAYRVSEGEDQHRRGIYVVWRRSAPYPSFVNFDAQVRASCVVKRSRSNTPLQALTLLNDPVYVEAAMGLARRIMDERPAASAEERIRHAYRVCLARAPKAAELSALAALYEAQLSKFKTDTKGAQLLIQDYPKPASGDAADFAAWYHVAAVLLNLDEMISKG